MSTTPSPQSLPKNELSFLPFQSDSPLPEVKLEELTRQEMNDQTELSFYEQEIAKLVAANTVIMAQLSSAFEEKKIIMNLISNAEKLEENNTKGVNKDKRVRRCATEIERKYICPHKGCEKSYGAEGSLLQHFRLKHPKTQTD
jgi:uncharacterized Zn-finger protein